LAVVVNVAVTEVTPLPLTVHAPVPLQPAPLQPAKVEPAAGFAVRVTGVPAEYVAKQVLPHWMPAGLLTMLPATSPALLTAIDLVAAVNAAATATRALPAMVQGPVPAQPPPFQPVNVEPAAGVALSVTGVPAGYDAVQSLPHRMPAGELAMVPAPTPTLLTATSRDDPSFHGVAQASAEYGEAATSS
jgi:hypothetical protein